MSSKSGNVTQIQNSVVRKSHCELCLVIGFFKCLMVFLRALVPLRSFGNNETKPLRKKMVLGKPRCIPQGAFISIRNSLKCARRSMPSGSRELPRAGKPGSLSGEKSKMEETKPAHAESSLLLVLRNRPEGAQTWGEVRMLRREPELHRGGSHRPGEREEDYLLICVTSGK